MNGSSSDMDNTKLFLNVLCQRRCYPGRKKTEYTHFTGHEMKCVRIVCRIQCRKKNVATRNNVKRHHTNDCLTKLNIFKSNHLNCKLHQTESNPVSSVKAIVYFVLCCFFPVVVCYIRISLFF